MGLDTQRKTKMTDGIDIELDTLKIEGDPTKLFEELAKAQAEFVPVPRPAAGQSGGKTFKYANYATVIRCVRPALSKYGISVIQPLHSRGDMGATTTILAGHGARITSSFLFKADYVKKDKFGNIADDPQEFGRCHTYYRRYQLQAMLGIEGDKDADDLPDVNEERAQFSEERKATAVAHERPEAASGVEPKTAPKASGTEKPAQDSVEKKPAVAKESKTNGSAKQSAASTESSKPATPAVADTKSLNEKLKSGMGQLNWSMDDLIVFFKEHVDPAGFTKAATLTVEQKTALFAKMVEIKQVAPF